MTDSLAEAHDHTVSADSYLRHVNAIAAAKAAHEDTGMALARAKKAAKEDAIDLDAHKMIEKLRKLEYDQQVIILRRFAEYGGYLEMTAFKQLNLFDAPQAEAPAAKPHPGVTVWAAGEAGLRAGRLGEPASHCPYEKGSQHAGAWIEKHHTGLAESLRADGMGDDAGDEEDKSLEEAVPTKSRGRGRAKANGGAQAARQEIPPIH